MKTKTIGPCPFCGGKSILSHGGTGLDLHSFVRCEICGAQGQKAWINTEYSCDERAIDIWNTRMAIAPKTVWIVTKAYIEPVYKDDYPDYFKDIVGVYDSSEKAHEKQEELLVDGMDVQVIEMGVE